MAEWLKRILEENERQYSTLPEWKKGSPPMNERKDDSHTLFGRYDFESEAGSDNWDGLSGREMLTRIRRSLQARLEGRNEGGDTEVMRLVDEIVKKALHDDKEGSTRPLPTRRSPVPYRNGKPRRD